jgi:hypothetical protein
VDAETVELIRQAVEAARAALPKWEAAHDRIHAMGPGREPRAFCRCFNPHIAIEFAEDWLAAPTNELGRLAETAAVSVGPRERWVSSIGQAIGAARNGFPGVAADYAREAIECSREVAARG